MPTVNWQARNGLEAGISGWLPEPLGFAIFGNQQDATALKTGGFTSHTLPDDAASELS